MISNEDAVRRVYGFYTKGSLKRLFAMADACRYIDRENIEGDIVECGVWKGGHIILARLIAPSRCTWLYDTYSGMPPPGRRDTKPDGTPPWTYWAKAERGDKMSLASLGDVRANLRQEGVLDDKLCRFIVGDVCKTLDDEKNLPDRIAILRLDTDWEASTKKELEVLYPRLVKGGVLIVDDYGHWLGCKLACQEYFKKNGIKWNEELKPIDNTAVIMIKR